MVRSLQTERPPGRRPSPRSIVLGLLLLIALAIGIERLSVSEEERVEAAVQAFFSAVEDENRAGVDVMLLDPFDYSGPNPIRSGDRKQMFAGLQELWEVADALDYIDKSPEIRIAQRSASHTSEGLVRFTWNQSLVVQRAKIEVTLLKGAPGADDPEAWKVRRVDVLELRRGVF